MNYFDWLILWMKAIFLVHFERECHAAPFLSVSHWHSQPLLGASSVRTAAGWLGVRTFLPALACPHPGQMCAVASRLEAVQWCRGCLQPVPEALRVTVWYQNGTVWLPKSTFVCSLTKAVFLVVTTCVQGWLFHDRLFLSCLICIRYPLYALTAVPKAGIAVALILG